MHHYLMRVLLDRFSMMVFDNLLLVNQSLILFQYVSNCLMSGLWVEIKTGNYRALKIK